MVREGAGRTYDVVLLPCRAKFRSKSTVEARRLNQIFELSSASNSAVLHHSSTAAIRTSCFCRTKQTS